MLFPTSPSGDAPETHGAPAAGFIVINPSGNRSRVLIDPVPFMIGRQAENNLVLRDNRASRIHARIVVEDGEYVVEDLNSRHGVYVNGQRATRQKLTNSDRIEFGVADSYKLIFTVEDSEIHRMLNQISSSSLESESGANNLAKLRALVDVARALQSSLSTDDVLASVVDAALSVTGTERGFLLLRDESELHIAVARDRHGAALTNADLKVPMSVINRALRTRRELLSMNFDPHEEGSVTPEMSVADLELRSVVCVPLVRVRTGGAAQETMIASMNDTAGLLYMDSRQFTADLSAGNRELLQTLALEASTILENARLLEEEREKQRMEEELNVARQIQRGLLPNSLPTDGWLRAAGSSLPSKQVGGDYFDVRRAGPDRWATVVADVSGKGVSAALLAALLEGAFLLAVESPVPMEELLARMNHFLNDRTKGEKYVTLAYCLIGRDGTLRWSNAAHPRPILLRANGDMETLNSTGLPLGMLEAAMYGVEETKLGAGDKLILFSDGLTEAENQDGEMFGTTALNQTVEAHAASSAPVLHAALEKALIEFTESSVLADDVTILVVEYRP